VATGAVASTEGLPPVSLVLYRRPAIELLRQLLRNRSAMLGGITTTLFVACGLVGIVMLAVPRLQGLFLDQNLSQALLPPPADLGGTDALGRNLLARVVVGMGVSLGVSLVVTVSSLVVGGVLGILAGYYRGHFDTLISGLVDVTWGFPIILLAVVLAGVLAPGLPTVVLAISLINWAGFARIVRGEVLSLREREFVKAARVLGVPDWRIMLRHLVPNIVGSILVMGSYYVAITIIAEAGLSFIGVGAQPPTPSLGQIISDGRNYWSIDIWVVVMPGLVLALAVWGLNTLGDGLRDLLDPRIRVRG
jgi:ABC-type dipeptide/oligopeptide/nickel transport system permease subunit